MNDSHLILKKEIGFSLFEALIALLVLSIGLLGASSMQLSALNNNQGAYSRFQAVNIANELSER
ncbi:MAG TPA: type IV pilus modification protein PilV, partial [Gammaproteobacteria bacterium]|nr:type IV pilus modification protein PilV [Gammaproteobacteria bacterium]